MEAALEDLLRQEKVARQAEEIDANAVSAILTQIVDLLRPNPQQLNEMVVALAKRRRQPKIAVQAMLRRCTAFLDDFPADNELLTTLRSVSEGKIHLEIEFARLTKRLAGVREAAGEIKAASSLLQEVQVETYGSMEKEEKLAFLLEQMRLLLALGDFIRFSIIAKKVNRKVLDEPQLSGEKVLFLEYMIVFHSNEKQWFEAAESYRQIFETTGDVAALQQMVLHLLFVPFSSEQSDLLRRYNQDERLHGSLRSLVSLVLGAELGSLPLDLPVSADQATLLQRRVNQHNIRTVQRYYRRITLARLGQLLQLSQAVTEEELRDMVSYEGLTAKINRPEGFVVFRKPSDTNSVLNSWGNDVQSLLLKVEEITQLIQREHILYA
jgi:26S proteasome regulatory subunit N5